MFFDWIKHSLRTNILNNVLCAVVKSLLKCCFRGRMCWKVGFPRCQTWRARFLFQSFGAWLNTGLHVRSFSGCKAVPLGGLVRGRPEQNASSVRLVLEGASSSVILPSHAESLHLSIDPYSYSYEQEKEVRHQFSYFQLILKT